MRFSDEALKEAAAVKLLQGGQDRAHVTGLTIDAQHSRDLDDAIWVEATDTGFKVDVSISDVAEYVKLGSAIDLEAAGRVETQYLRTTNFPMIPARLSEDLLSLLPGDLKCCLTVRIWLRPDGEVAESEIFESVLQSAGRLSHDKVNDAILTPSSKFHDQLALQQRLAEALYEWRRESGACAFYDLRTLTYADEDGIPRALDADFFHAQMIVQEFMILANTEVAKWLAHRDIPIIFRNHAARSSAPDRSTILSQVDDAVANPAVMAPLQARMAMWFEKARYGTQITGHFGLNLPAYTHFTSPIRRYVDLINHRMVKAALRGTERPYSTGALQTLAQAINDRRDVNDRASEEHHKEKTKELRREQAKSILASMPPIQFHKVLKQAVKDDELSDSIRHELERRIKREVLESPDYYYVLFRASEKYDAIKRQCLPFLLAKPHVAMMVMNIAQQKNALSPTMRLYEDKSGSDFYAWLAHGNRVTLVAAINPNKKIAHNTAAALWLKAYVEKTHTREDCGAFKAPAEVPVAKVAPTTPANNFVSRLQELCQVRKLEPRYEFSSDGPSHAPTFACTASLTQSGKEVKGSGRGATKAQAKQEAAASLLRSL